MLPWEPDVNVPLGFETFAAEVLCLLLCDVVLAMEGWGRVLSDELWVVEGRAGASLSLWSVSVRLLDSVQLVEENATCAM